MIEYLGESYNDVIKEGLVLVDFFATWCGPCKMLMPVLDELSGEINDVKFVKVDIDKYRPLAIETAIRSVPTMVLYLNGKEVAREVGYQPKEKLLVWFDSFR